METDRIKELVSPFLGGASLRPLQFQQLSQYLGLLLRWNAKTNLTAIRDEESIVTRHFGESLFAARHLFPQSSVTGAHSVADLGSGAGFPGIPLKIYAPGIALTLIESQNKKATFLKEVVRALHLDRGTVFNGRAEQFPNKVDLVTLRAVENFESTLPVAASLIGKRSETASIGPATPCQLALLIGSAQAMRAQELLPSFKWEAPLPIPHSSARILLIGKI